MGRKVNEGGERERERNELSTGYWQWGFCMVRMVLWDRAMPLFARVENIGRTLLFFPKETEFQIH